MSAFAKTRSWPVAQLVAAMRSLRRLSRILLKSMVSRMVRFHGSREMKEEKLSVSTLRWISPSREVAKFTRRCIPSQPRAAPSLAKRRKGAAGLAR